MQLYYAKKYPFEMLYYAAIRFDFPNISLPAIALICSETTLFVFPASLSLSCSPTHTRTDKPCSKQCPTFSPTNWIKINKCLKHFLWNNENSKTLYYMHQNECSVIHYYHHNECQCWPVVVFTDMNHHGSYFWEERCRALLANLRMGSLFTFTHVDIKYFQ